MRRCYLLFTCSIAFLVPEVGWQATVAHAQSGNGLAEGEPVVARVNMKLGDGEKPNNIIEKGDVLTIVEEREANYLIVTHSGSQGVVDKVNAVKVAESGEIYSQLIKEHPQEGRYYTMRASSWWALGKPEKAIEDFDKAIELGYEQAHAYASRGMFLASRGDFAKAIEDYNRALELDLEDQSPLVNLAAAKMNLKNYDEAIADYTKLLDARQKANENANAILSQRATAYKAAGKMDEAIKDFDQILKVDPTDFNAVMGRGYIHFQQANHKNAVLDFSRAIELKPDDPIARNNRGYNLFQLGQHAAALEDYNQSLALSPKYALALQNRAWVLATSDVESVHNPELAVESAKAACELSNYKNISDVSALAAALAAAGKFKDAVLWQEKVVDMVGDNYKDFAHKTLVRYQQEKPFAADPGKANGKE